MRRAVPHCPKGAGLSAERPSARRRAQAGSLVRARHAGLRPDRPASEAGELAPPAWLDLLVRLAACTVVALCLVGVPLALLGELRRLPVLVGGALVLAGLLALHGRPARRRAGRAATAGALAALAIAGGTGIWNGVQSYEHLIVDGDPAVYVVTGAVLARSGGLTVPTQAEELYGGAERINFAGSGWFDSPDEPTVYPQFFHGLPVLLAVATWLDEPLGVDAPVGAGLALLVVPVIAAFSLLAVYAFAARHLRPAWAVLATATTAVLLPQLHFSRDAFSELPSQLLVFAGLALLGDALARRSPRAGLLAGLVLGGSAMVRIDAFLYLVPITAALVLLRAGRTGLAVVAGLAVGTAVGLVDGYVGSPVYVESVQGSLLQVALLLAVVAVAALLAWRTRWAPRLVARLSPRLALPAAAGLTALAAFAWFVRPYVETARDIPARTNRTIAGLQQAEGLPVDIPRSYDEDTMLWLSWYLGPVALALGVAGLAYLTYRLLKGRDLRLLPFALLLVVMTAVYVWKPGIFPVQYWASRRFLPVTFPGLVVTATLLLAWVWTRARVVAAVGAVALVAFPLALLPGAVLPKAYDGVTAAVTDLCGTLQPDDVVLLVGGGPTASGLVQAVQGYCGVAAGATAQDARPSDVRAVARAADEAGRRLVVLSPVPDPPLVPGTAFAPVFDVTVPTVALALTKRPDEVYPFRLVLFSAVI